MPRNSSGNYSLPAGNPVAPDTLIETLWANPTMSDIGAELTNSLDRQGRGTMLASLKIFDGTVIAPGISFNAESSTGLYRPSSHVLGIALAGIAAILIGDTSITMKKATTFESTATVQSTLTVAHPTGASTQVIKGATAAQQAQLILDSLTSPANRAVLWRTNAVNRWQMVVTNAAEAGANAGSNFNLQRYDDAGTLIDTPMSIARSTGIVTFTAGIASSAPVGMPNGTAALPGLSFTSDPDTGLYRSAANTLAISAGTTPTMTFAPALISGLVPADFASTLDVAGITTLGSTFSVGGVSTFNAAVTVAHPTGSATLTVKPTTGGQIASAILDSGNATATTRRVSFRTNALPRWDLATNNNAESGANAGSNFNLNRYDDAGALIDIPLSINRATGIVTFANGIASSDVLSLDDGTLAAPGLSFTSDADLGLYRAAANVLGVSAGAVEAARFHSQGLSVRSTQTLALSLYVDRLGNAVAPPAYTAGTTAAFTGATSAGSPSYVSITAGNTSESGINFGDTDADNRGSIRFRHSTDIMALTSASFRYQFVGTSGGSAIAQTSPGVESLSVEMNATSKYTNALKFGSTDSAFTTTNPKFGAVIVGEATETYDTDLKGGMALVFFTQPNAPGAAGSLLEAARINQSQRMVVGDALDNFTVLGFSTVPRLGVVGTASGEGLGLATFNASPQVRLLAQGSRNATPGAHTLVANNDNIFAIIAAGSDGTQFVRLGSITFSVDGTPALNDMPGRIVFSVTPDGTTTPVEALRISQNGAILATAPQAGAPYSMAVRPTVGVIPTLLVGGVSLADTATLLTQNTGTAASAHAANVVEVGGGAAGDAIYQAGIAAGQYYSWGLDNSDTDSWVLSVGAALGTTNALKVTTARVVSLGVAPADSDDNLNVATTSFVQNVVPVGNGRTYSAPARAFNTNYTNTADRALFVTVSFDFVDTVNTWQVQFLIAGSIRQSNSGLGPRKQSMSMLVPPGIVYQVQTVGAGTTPTLAQWSEC